MNGRMIIYKCKKDNIETGSRLCPVCHERTEKIRSDIYWCRECGIPLYDAFCPLCGRRAGRLASDVRPVFPQERLLLEVIAGKPFAWREASVWSGIGNRYYVDGERIPFKASDPGKPDVDAVRERYRELEAQNDGACFEEMIGRFVRANQRRLEEITSGSIEYIRSVAGDRSTEDMFLSFSGGKNSTVTASLVMRALGTQEILHIFGDTTLELPATQEYVERYRKEHPGTPVVSARNRDGEFEELCRVMGPPSRVMRWCCPVFRTDVMEREISAIFREQKEIVAFYGVRGGESARRGKYDGMSDSSGTAKRIAVTPVIDWLDFDVWLYLLGNHLDFNGAYRLGYARVGCWCCPNNTGWSEFLSEIYLPEKTARFRELK